MSFEELKNKDLRIVANLLKDRVIALLTEPERDIDGYSKLVCLKCNK